MSGKSKPRKGKDIDASQFDFFNFEETVVRLEQIAKEEGYPSSDIMLVDEGTNGIGKQEVYIHKTIDQNKSRKSLERKIIRKGGDINWLGHT